LVASGSSMLTPMARSAPAISVVSLLLSAPEIALRPFASAASSSARLVIDFDPGGVTRPRNGRSVGVMLRAAVMGARVPRRCAPGKCPSDWACTTWCHAGFHGYRQVHGHL